MRFFQSFSAATARPVSLSVFLLVCVLGLSACQNAKPQYEGPSDKERFDKFGTIDGNDGFTLFDSGDRPRNAGGGELGVNAFLWRASLETINFMPLTQADPFGGTIITDWYTPPATPAERVKLTVFITDRALRADALKVQIFRQEQTPDGQWRDVASSSDAQRKLEDTILARARQIRIQQSEQSQ